MCLKVSEVIRVDLCYGRDRSRTTSLKFNFQPTVGLKVKYDLFKCLSDRMNDSLSVAHEQKKEEELKE